MADYPAGLPGPDHLGYSGSQDSGVLRTATLVQLYNQARAFNATQRQVSVTFSMKNDIYPQWILWVRDNAYKWFNLPIVSSAPNTGILTTQSVRFITPLQYTKRGDGWLSVSVTMEIQPEQTNYTLPTV